jgi:hypothetical protein
VGSGGGSDAAAFTLHDDRNACAGLTDGFAEIDRRDGLRDWAFGILVGLDILIDRALEFLLNGLIMFRSSLGDRTGDAAERSIGLPSGIVFGGDMVILPVRLPVLFSRPPVSVGDAGPSLLLGEIVDPDVRDAMWRSLTIAITLCGIGVPVWIGASSSDGFACDSKVRMTTWRPYFGSFRNTYL